MQDFRYCTNKVCYLQFLMSTSHAERIYFLTESEEALSCNSKFFGVFGEMRFIVMSLVTQQNCTYAATT